MNALIFAAGLGTRLGSLTDNRPKALLEVAGKPMLLHAIEKLIETGVSHIVINVHHHAEVVKDYIASLRYPHTELRISDESGQLLETGGALLKAAPLFIPHEPILLYNADVITDVDLSAMLAFHRQKKGLATLMVKNRVTSRYFLFNENACLSGWTNTSTGQVLITRGKADDLTPLAFSGIHIVEPGIIPLLGSPRKFSITQGYLDLSQEHAFYGWEATQGYWFDIGTPEKLHTAEQYLNRNGKN